MATIDSLDIQINASFRNAASAIDDLNTRLNTTASLLNSVGANLSRQISPMTSATRNLSQSFNSGNTSIRKLHESTKSLTSSFAKLYSKIYLLRKGLKAFSSTIKSSMDYVEDLNYFNAAFGQVAEAGVAQWEEAGYKSAQTYYDSFAQRAEQLTQKMTGYQVMESGMLLSTGQKNLGIDPSQLMNYQAVFAQMSSSMGTTSENALLLSDVLTKIGADLASVKNMDFNKVWEDMASGLAGMSRTLDKYGVNIRNVNLQQKLNELGIQANITKLNQNEKALLRTIILLDTTRYAWADMSDTINQPANQLRLIQANFSNLARTIGNIFLPIVAKILPYINAVVIALQRLAEKIVLLLGFEDFEWGGLGGGTISDALSTIYDETENVADAMGDATKKAEEFQNQLLGFDEAYKLTEPAEDTADSAASSGGLSAPDTAALDAAFKKIAQEYQKAWDDAFAEMEQRSTAIADGIIGAFERGDYKGIGRYISANISDALESINWNSVYQSVRKFGTGLAEFLNGLITPNLFENVGKTIAGVLNAKIYAVLSFGQTFDFVNLGESIAAGINGFFATYNFGALAETINVWAKGIFNTIISAISKVDWEDIGKQIGIFLSRLNFFEIGVKIVQTLYEGIKSGFALFTGVFKKSSIETTILSLAVMPKLLKAITASKIVTGFKKLSGALKLVTKAFAGNQASVALLLTQYPKLGKAVSVLQDSFQRLMFGLHYRDIKGGINAALTNIRNNLTGLQKGVITAVTGFAEFNIVSDTFKGLTLGTENLVAGIAKIGGVVAIAATAMYTALGPAGLAVTAIVGVVGAIKGINDAFDEIKAEEIGNIINNAMSNPGGVPLNEIASNFATAFSEAASGFDVIKEKSSEMDSVQKSIESTWTEIYKIKEAMENGVLSVEEGKAKLDTLFSELATLTEQKFSAMNTAIMSAYGEGGSFRTALENMGADTESAIDTMITYGYQNSEKAKQIAEELVGMNIGDEGYTEKIAELQRLTGEMSSFEQATSNFTYDMNSLQGKIDYSQIFLEDGSIDTEALKAYLGEATAALGDYETSLDEAGKEISQYWQEIYNSATATEEQKTVAKANLGYIPQAIESMKSDAELQIVGFTDLIQQEFIERTGDIVQGASGKWEEKSSWGKFWQSQAGYVSDAVKQHQENINELSSTIESSLEQLGIDGAGWGNDVGEKIYDSIIQYTPDNGLEIKDNWEYELEKATEELPNTAMSRGKETSEGYAKGIENNSQIVNKAAIAMTNIAMKAIQQTQNSHSPSRVTEEFGKNAVEGYNLGISNNSNSTKTNVQQWIDSVRQTMSNSNLSSLSEQNGLSVVTGFNQGINANVSRTYDTLNRYTESIQSGFSNISNSFYNIGESVIQGFSNGLTNKQDEIYKRAQTISNNVVKTIKNALSIHSPSKIMFELGNYTMQGFRNGLESLYRPILSSVKGFSSDLQIAPAPDLKDIYRNYKYADISAGGSGQYGQSVGEDYLSQMKQAAYEGVLQAIRDAGGIKAEATFRVENDKDSIFKITQEKEREYVMRTGKSAFLF